MKESADFAKVKAQVLAHVDQMLAAYRDALARECAIPLPDLVAAIKLRIEQPSDAYEAAIGMMALLALMHTLAAPPADAEEVQP